MDRKYNFDSIDEIYPYTYKSICLQHLIGLHCICFAKSQLKERINVINTNAIKTGLFGAFGNKGYITLTIKYNNKSTISFAVGHLEAGKNSNEERIETLNNYIENKFKNSDFWIILGDLYFQNRYFL